MTTGALDLIDLYMKEFIFITYSENDWPLQHYKGLQNKYLGSDMLIHILIIVYKFEMLIQWKFT